MTGMVDGFMCCAKPKSNRAPHSAGKRVAGEKFYNRSFFCSTTDEYDTTLCHVHMPGGVDLPLVLVCTSG